MATSHQIGQYRFRNGCAKDVNHSLTEYKSEVDIGEDDGAKMTFTDFRIMLTNNAQFKADTDYYCELNIPVDFNNEYTFTIKLEKGQGQTTGTGSSYQFLRRYTLKRGGDSNNMYGIALYCQNPKETNTSKEIVKSVVLDETNKKDNFTTAENGKLYWKGEGSNRVFYIGNSNKQFELTNKVVKASMVAAWRSNYDGSKKTKFAFIFRPIEDGFRQISFQIDRGPEDYGLINSETQNGNTVVIDYGRKIDITKVDTKLCELTNLINQMKNPVIDRIGVWGHPEQMMAINGEQIQLGPSGYYELQGLEITSLSVMAIDDDYRNSSFTIDYEYTKED